jgi:hypothetical protein
LASYPVATGRPRPGHQRPRARVRVIDKVNAGVRMVVQHAFERLDRLILTAAKATLLFAAIATFLPIVFRVGLRRFSAPKFETK